MNREQHERIRTPHGHMPASFCLYTIPPVQHIVLSYRISGGPGRLAGESYLSPPAKLPTGAAVFGIIKSHVAGCDRGLTVTMPGKAVYTKRTLPIRPYSRRASTPFP